MLSKAIGEIGLITVREAAHNVHDAAICVAPVDGSVSKPTSRRCWRVDRMLLQLAVAPIALGLAPAGRMNSDGRRRRGRHSGLKTAARG
eukprot:6013590-Prymnesium_polylepis.2